MTIEKIKQLVNDGVKVYYNSYLYEVVKDFEGDYVIRCNNSGFYGQELLTDEHDLSKFFIK